MSCVATDLMESAEFIQARSNVKASWRYGKLISGLTR
jgi:hypothetical protein